MQVKSRKCINIGKPQLPQDKVENCLVGKGDGNARLEISKEIRKNIAKEIQKLKKKKMNWFRI